MKLFRLYKLAAVLAAWVFAQQAVRAQEALTLEVNGNTGITTIVNSTGTAVDLDGYDIRSATGMLSETGWTSLATADSDWEELDNALLSDNALGEVNTFASTSLGAGGGFGIGAPFATFDRDAAESTAGFGVVLEDLVFEYSELGVDSLISGDVRYVGASVINNLVLNVNPTSGNVQLENQSSIPVTIDGIILTSVAGQLDTSWSGITASGWDPPLNDSATGLAQVNPFASLLIDSGDTHDLGQAFSLGVNAADRDLVFNYIINDDENASPGEVRYVEAVAGDADFNGDTDVDGADFLTWQRGFGLAGQTDNRNGDANGSGAVDGVDLTVWESQYGTPASVAASVSLVPEPGAASLLILAASLMAVYRRK